MKLPQHLIDKAIKSNNEYGWQKADVLEVIEAARKNQMAVIGGQVQYVWPDGICELYWLNYDSEDRKENENWITYCDRASFECSERFKKIIANDIEKEALSFKFIKNKIDNGEDINAHQVFILYFNDPDREFFG